MLRKLAPFLIVMFSIIGILDAGKITWDEFNNVIPSCAPPFECATVLNSPWAYLGPLPLATYGLVFYIAFLVIGSLLVLEVKHITVAGRVFAVATLAKWMGIFGFLFSLYLITLMGFIIKAWCLYCLISAINCTVLFLVTRLLKPDPAVKVSSTEE